MIFFEVFNDRLGRKLSSYVTWHNVQTSNKKCPLSNFQTLNMCLMIDVKRRLWQKYSGIEKMYLLQITP